MSIGTGHVKHLYLVEKNATEVKLQRQKNNRSRSTEWSRGDPMNDISNYKTQVTCTCANVM